MKKIHCPKCKTIWDKDELIDSILGIKTEKQPTLKRTNQGLLYCSNCFFSLVDEFGAFIELSPKDIKDSGLENFNPYLGDGSEGSAQDLRDDFPSAIIEQREAAD